MSTERVKVAVLDDFQDAWRHTHAIKRLDGLGEIEFFTRPLADATALAGFRIVIANRERTRFTADLLGQMADVKLLVQTGGRAPNIDLEAATARGIAVAKAAGGSSTGAAELTIGLILAALRHIASANAAMHAGGWPAPLGHELRGKTLGLVGVGGVGGQVARMAAPFGVRLLAYGRSLTADRARELGGEAAALEDLLQSSDVVSVHVPLTPESRDLIDERKLGLMKPSAYLINTSRGPLVNEQALIRALAEQRLAGAALDVFNQEPLPDDHPFRKMSNVVLTPHLGWPTDVGFERFAGPAIEAILAYLDGRAFERFN
jgi:phosphoglycerate dehydrogenase-like enzyme